MSPFVTPPFFAPPWHHAAAAFVLRVVGGAAVAVGLIVGLTLVLAALLPWAY